MLFESKLKFTLSFSLNFISYDCVYMYTVCTVYSMTVCLFCVNCIPRQLQHISVKKNLPKRLAGSNMKMRS